MTETILPVTADGPQQNSNAIISKRGETTVRELVVDIETFYDKKAGYDIKSMCLTTYIRDSRFKLLGLAYRFLDDERTHWIEGNHAVEAWIQSINWAETILINHNSKFDASVLAWRFGVKAASYRDTLALAKAVLGQNVSSHSLGRLADYLGLPKKGDIEKDKLDEYCKNDVEICKSIYERLSPQFPASQWGPMDWTIRCFVEPVLRLDTMALEKGVADEKKRREDAIARSGVGRDVLSSNRKLAEYLRSQGIAVPTKTSTRTGAAIPAFAKTDEGLSQIAAAAPEIYEGRLAAKSNLLETRGESLLAVARTGSFPFDVAFSGADHTHRYSGRDGAGGNAQNFTRGSFLRRAVCSPKDYRLVVGDFAAIELRLLAWIAREPRLMSKIINNEDIYADFASTKYGRKITKADKKERQYGKESILGLGYGMGVDKFIDRIRIVLGVEISREEGWNTINLYRKTYFNVPKLWDYAQAAIPLVASGKIGCLWFAPFIKVRKNALILPSGLEIKYPNLRSIITQGRNGPRTEWVYDVYRKVYEAEETKLYGGKMTENMCQALAGELCKEAIGRIDGVGLRCVGQVHDEILGVSMDGPTAASRLKMAMERPPLWMPTLCLKAEVGYGDNWQDAKA
jgi:hypothetical protein